METILREVIIDLYARKDGGAEAFEALCQRAITDMHGVTPAAVGDADSEYIKHQAIHSIEGYQGLANAIRQRRGEPVQRPR